MDEMEDGEKEKKERRIYLNSVVHGSAVS